jgi:transcriptional regulator with XRE-family HTH domain
VRSIRIGKALKAIREEAGLTQNALARRAKMTASQVSQIESGKRPDPQFSTIARLAAALGVSLDEVAAQSGFETSAAPRSAVARDPIVATETALLAIQRDVERLDRKVGDALKKLPTPRR